MNRNTLETDIQQQFHNIKLANVIDGGDVPPFYLDILVYYFSRKRRNNRPYIYSDSLKAKTHKERRPRPGQNATKIQVKRNKKSGQTQQKIQSTQQNPSPNAAKIQSNATKNPSQADSLNATIKSIQLNHYI
jgi:hypothetical protein